MISKLGVKAQHRRHQLPLPEVVFQDSSFFATMRRITGLGTKQHAVGIAKGKLACLG